MHHGRLIDVVSSARSPADSPQPAPSWHPPIHKTVATRRDGIRALADAICDHRTHLEQTGGLARRERERAAAELETIIQQESLRAVLARTDTARLGALIDQIVRRELDPYAASQRLLGR
jgi:LAO/AO transport system kinase